METRNAVIKSADIGYEDHGILTFFLGFEGGSWGAGLPLWDLRNDCVDFIAAVLRTVGVDSVSKLVGKPIRVTFDGQMVKSIQHFTDDARVFDPREEAEVVGGE